MKGLRVGVIVQARMSSSRFPGKVLHEVSGKPLLGYLLESLKHCTTVEMVVVATSDHPSDDSIFEYCRDVGCAFFRGPLEDVAARMCLAATQHELGAFVRVCGDSPLLDYRLVDEGVRLFRENECDLVSNVSPRTYPKGQSVEVINVNSLCEVVNGPISSEEREHVTRHFYSNPNVFKVVNFESSGQYGGESVVVDTKSDMESFEKIVARMNRPHWEYDWKSVLELGKEVEYD